MQEAKKLAQEYQEMERPERTELHMDGLKPSINNLLLMYLPEDINIKEAETIAMVMYEMIWNPNGFVRQEKKESQQQP
jgi:hypothetical protein